MNISINPWYYCNFRCNFCYLTEQQLGDKKLLDLKKLESLLSEIVVYDKIEQVDFYGGEIGILPTNYFNEMKNICKFYGAKSFNIITNLSMINENILDTDCNVSVSYDFDCRESHELVWKNMKKLPKKFSVLMLVSNCLIHKDVDEMISKFNNLDNILSVELKPYSTNQSNQHNVSFLDYEEFVKKWIESTIDKKFDFVNEFLIKDSIDKIKNSFSDDHVYITPNGKYAVLEFDMNDNEFFKEYDTFQDYLNWCKIEQSRVSKNKFCSNCEYFGNCLSEHLRQVTSLDKSCNGFKLLIDWYKNRDK